MTALSVVGAVFLALAGTAVLVSIGIGVVAFCSSRGEEAGVPEVDELMVIAEAIADNEDNENWRQWEDELKEAGR